MSQRIAVCNAQIPFVRGGAESLALALVDRLRERGHSVELIQLPFRWYPKTEVLKGYLAWRLVNLEESEGQPIDRVIALKFPAFVISHPHKVTWLIQQFRQAYELYGTEYSHFDSSAADIELRRAVWEIDTCTLSESRHIFSISDNVGKRLQRFNALQAETLYPPPALDGRFYTTGYGDYILSVSRLNRMKRVHHLVQAMGRVRTPVRCRIVGEGPELPELKRLARKVGAEKRIDFLGFVGDDQLLEQYAGCLAVYYAPVDEDYGIASVEAMKSGKPVLTTRDSGGVLEFVQDRVTGLVTPPDDLAALAQSMDELYEDRGLAGQLGANGQRTVEPITWDATIDRLLEV